MLFFQRIMIIPPRAYRACSVIEVRDNLAVGPVGKVAQRGRVDAGRDRVDATVAKDELNDRGVPAAELVVGRVKGAERQGDRYTSDRYTTHSYVGLLITAAVNDTVGYRIRAQIGRADVFLPDHYGVAQPVRDGTERDGGLHVLTPGFVKPYHAHEYG